MNCRAARLGIAVGIGVLALGILGVAPLQLFAGETAPVCFWSVQGLVCVERPIGAVDAESLMAALLDGPTSQEQARGLWSALPDGTTADGVDRDAEGLLTVRLRVPAAALGELDHESFEILVRQVGGTLEPLQWSDLRIYAWDVSGGAFVPLAAFLPQIPAPRKGEGGAIDGGLDGAPGYVGQPPSVGQGQPQGSLSGKTVYVSAGHGWMWNDTLGTWRTQRPPYPTGGYSGPIIEDHNNAEVVDQYLLQYLWNAGARVIPVRERDMNSTEVVVDDDAPTAGTGYAETGTWLTSSLNGYHGHYRYTSTVTGAATATAVWTATLPADGRYAVYVWYRQGSNRVPDARYTVAHAGGETQLVVDQRDHGSTWHYVGTYGFLAGQEARVTLSNQSSVTGAAVIADAVRFGGGTFDDLSGIGTAATYAPNEPWWEIAAFYYTQRMGMDEPLNDIVARPVYARWEHAGTGDDAVYISWHTNGCSGGYQTHTRGTMSIIHNGVDNPPTPGSESLRDIVHAELVADIQAGWDPTWPEDKRAMNLGELRELWDEDPAARMPGALFEIAYHDHPTDTDALKEPAFEMLAARAMLQGIVKYFEARDGIDLKLLPEPPTHLAVRNAGGGRLRVSWQAPPTDGVGLVGDAATGYRVYTSTSGLGWSDGVSVAGTTAYTLTGLSVGEIVFVRVAATNDGGESFPTEVLAARVGQDAGVLLVPGFDRLNRTMLIPETDPTEGDNVRMFLDRMNAYSYAVQHGETVPYAFDSASNEAVIDGSVSLGSYGIVDWILGEESTNDETLDGTEQTLLAAYLDGGGALFISGAEIGWDLDAYGSTGDKAFYNTYLRADYAGDDAGTYQVTASSGAIFDGLDPFRFDAAGMYDADYADQLTPLNGSTPVLAYQGGVGGTAAVQYADGGCGQLVHFGFPFETIEPGDRVGVMTRTLNFLCVCLVEPVETAITVPVDGSVHKDVPDLMGTAVVGDVDGLVLQRVDVQVERDSDGQFWTGGGWGGETWLAASGTDAWSYTLPGLTDSDYTLRARAWRTDPCSDTSPAEVTFTYDTISPTITVLITPTGGVTLTVPVWPMEWQASAPDGGSALSYVVRLDGQVIYTTTQPVYTMTRYLPNGAHTWGVQVVDAAGNRSAWVTDTFALDLYNFWLPVIRKGSE